MGLKICVGRMPVSGLSLATSSAVDNRLCQHVILNIGVHRRTMIFTTH